ncbi:MAG: helix-turn-helix transcriptional regulator [Clostridia bacterium]|nr:helix-turn-helix transcriptional regulator [Clostridia bacterium]
MALYIKQNHNKEVVQNSYVYKDKFAELTAQICEDYAVLPNTNAESTYHNDINRSIVYMSHHINEPLTLSDLASVAKMGFYNYCATFKKVMGTSPWCFFLEMRVNLAVKLLTDTKTNYKIITISSMCGFNTIANFNKVFRSVTGKTPSEYRDLKKGMDINEEDS